MSRGVKLSISTRHSVLVSTTTTLGPIISNVFLAILKSLAYVFYRRQMFTNFFLVVQPEVYNVQKNNDFAS